LPSPFNPTETPTVNKPDVQPRPMPCYPVPADRLGDALAGRLLAVPNASKPDTGATDWLYCDGFAAGVRWACESASFDDLERLAADNAQRWLGAPPWLRGFIDGALHTLHDMATVRYRAA